MENLSLHRRAPMRRTWFNRLFSLVYIGAISALLYHNLLNLIQSPTIISLLMFIADVVLAFMCFSYQAYRMSPIRREVFPENVAKIMKDERDYPALDVFICTADPYMEPPMVVVNTAISVMAYDYPTDKLSIYVSDDGGSQLTLFAFMEAAKFARHWLPYCKKNKIVERCPEAYFASKPNCFPETDAIKLMYKSMKTRVEEVVEKGKVCGDYITNEVALKAFNKWTYTFTCQDHPALIEVLLESSVDKDVGGHAMPNLVYVSREKSKATFHNYKGGALNVLIRVSASMTNAPIILTIDCDMYSNDPTTPLRVLCYYLDPCMDPQLGYIQFPQLLHVLNANDIYSAEFKYESQINPAGMDGLSGTVYTGSGCFFRRRIFFGDPFSIFPTEIPEVSPHHRPNKPLQSQDVLLLAHHVASCNYEAQTKWGAEVGFRYGSLVEDYYTSYQLQCQGWKSVFCHPNRAAFLGNAPTNLYDLLNQTKRWSIGLLDIGLCKYSPLTFGFRHLSFLQNLCYIRYTFWLILSIPILVYAFLPQLALFNSFPIFPKISDPWFGIYVFLFFGAYVQDFMEFILAGGTVQRWWNCQRMWLIRGLSSFSFSLLEHILKSHGISSYGFNVTSKVVDDERIKRYQQGIFEFGVSSPMFLPLTMAAIINLFSFLRGMLQVFRTGNFETLFVQLFIAGFGVVNSWPVYEAMVLRTDKGKMPVKITLTSIGFVWILYLASPYFANSNM